MSSDLITTAYGKFGFGPGLNYTMRSTVYHSDPCFKPSLNSGIARTILKKSLAHAKLEHPRFGASKNNRTPSLSFGAYVHGLVAGDVSDFELGDFATFDGKAAKEWCATVEASGKEPVLQVTAEKAGPVAEALVRHAGDGLTINPISAGHAEVTAIWREDDTWCRIRLDRLVCDAYADIWDWKTTDDITDRGIVSTIVEYGYHIQAAFYMRGVVACLPEYRGRVTFTLVFVEKTEPYTVRRVKLDPTFLAVGKIEVQRAIDKWSQAMASGEFPGIPVDTFEAVAPAWMDDELEITAGIAPSGERIL